MRITAFTDGAAKGNPGPGGWGAIVATPDGRVRELGGGAPLATNNQMELTAALQALRALRGVDGVVDLHADSTYVIRGITEWIRGWRRRGWQTAEGRPVLNRDLWEALAGEVAERGRGGVQWHYVRGHAAVPGNERADEIAVGFATGKRVALYDGPLVGYPIALHDIPEDTALPKRSSRGTSAKAQPAYCYLSLVDGVPMRHATWADCERRVKGVSGAKYKKATSADDEQSILRAWGVRTG
ncbi:MAG: viroplasmin family protein [Candidatus Binatia bacterium]